MTAIKDYYNQLKQRTDSFIIPEWDKEVYVGPLTFSQYQKLEQALAVSESERAFETLQTCCKDKDGNPAFSVEELKDIRLYSPSWIVTRVATEVFETQAKFKEDQEDSEGN